MGRIQDALKKAEDERRRKRGGGAPPAEPPARSDQDVSEGAPQDAPASAPKSPPVNVPMAKTAPALDAPAKSSVAPTSSRVATGSVRSYGEVLLTYHDPNDYRTEQFRALRTNLHVLDPEPHVIGVTSALDGEGTGLTAANLAVSYSEEANVRTLVVDADLRRSVMSEILGYDSTQIGLVELLEGSATAENVTHDSGIRGVSYVASGRPIGNPGGLISGSSLREAVAVWRQAYDRVVVVMPSVYGANDAAHIGRDMDGVVVVVKLGETPRKKTERAVDVLAASGVPLVGCVLTNADSDVAELRT